MKEARRWAAWFFLAWACSFAYLFLVYYPAATITFAHHDQYRFFSMTGPDRPSAKLHRSSDPQWSFLRLIGRPISAELEYQVYKRVDVVNDLTPIRVFGIGLCSTAMAIFICFLLELGLSAPLGFCLSGVIYALPAMQFSVYFAGFNHPVAHILALIGALLMRLGSRVSAHDPHWYWNLRRIASHMVAITLLVVAMLSYPPSAFVVLFPIAAELAIKGIAGWPATRRHLIRDLFLTAVAGAVYFAIIRHYYVVHGGHGVPQYKIEMNAAIGERIYGVVQALVYPALNLWNIHISMRITIAVACFLVSGMGVLMVRQFRATASGSVRQVHSQWTLLLGQVAVQCSARTQRASRCLQLLAAMVLVLLVSETTYFAAPLAMGLYRIHFALGGIIVILLAGSAASWGRLLPAPWRHKAALALAVAVSVLGGLCAHTNVLQTGLNDKLELSFISAQISTHAAEPMRRIHIIRSQQTPYTFNGLNRVPGEEFNVPTSDCPTSISHMVASALLNVFDHNSFMSCGTAHTIEAIRAADPRVIVITYSAHGEPVISSPDTLVIDMDHLLRVVSPTKPPMPPVPATARHSNWSSTQRVY